MTKNNLIKILNKEFDPKYSLKNDVIGLIVDGRDNIKNVYITLDLTLDVILDAIKKNADFIISHHPIYFGEFVDEIIKDKLLKSKISLLKSKEINYFCIHTNADFNDNSIAKKQAKMINLGGKIENLRNNIGIIIRNSKKLNREDIISILVDNLYIKRNFIKTNSNETDFLNNIIIGSGASGDLVYNLESRNSFVIVGEVKYHHWIFAKENNIKLFEIGHSSENIFKNILEDFLSKSTDVNVILSNETFEDLK